MSKDLLNRRDFLCSTIKYPKAPPPEKTVKMTNDQWVLDMRAIDKEDSKILGVGALNSHLAKASDEVLAHIDRLEFVQGDGFNYKDQTLELVERVQRNSLYKENKDHWVFIAATLNLGRVFSPGNPFNFSAELVKPYISLKGYVFMRLFPIYQKDKNLFNSESGIQKQGWWYQNLEEELSNFSEIYDDSCCAAAEESKAQKTLTGVIEKTLKIGIVNIIASKVLKLADFKISPEKIVPTDEFDNFLLEYLKRT